MKNVMLIGDSIRLIGYGTKVPEILGEEFTVFQPTDNCRFSQYTLRGLRDWFPKNTHLDVVHWNNGIWDMCDYYGDGCLTSPDIYVGNMIRIARILKMHADTVIFATTTPIADGHPNIKNISVDYYNSLIVPKLEAEGIIINDLNATVKTDMARYICEDKVHLTADGIGVCAEQVAGIIRKYCQ